MKTAWLVLCLGFAAGLAAHSGWFVLRRPVQITGPTAPLEWMQADLHLTPEQFARIKALHEQSRPQLQALAARAARMRAELENFEQLRRADGSVDFLRFARFVEEHRTIDRLCVESTRRLIAATSGELTPTQRLRYLALLDPATVRSVN